MIFHFFAVWSRFSNARCVWNRWTAKYVVCILMYGVVFVFAFKFPQTAEVLSWSRVCFLCHLEVWGIHFYVLNQFETIFTAPIDLFLQDSTALKSSFVTLLLKVLKFVLTSRHSRHRRKPILWKLPRQHILEFFQQL